MEKRNYWLKLKEDFFSQPYVKKLRRIAGGDTYTIIYQKILLISVKTDGYIVFQGIEKTLAEELALILDEDIDNITVTLEFMKANKLIEQMENENEYLLPDMLSLIGSESESAKWVRAYRDRKRQSLILSANSNNIQNSGNNKTLHCKGDVRECNENVIIDIDIDKDKEKEIYKEKEKFIVTQNENNIPPNPPLAGGSPSDEGRQEDAIQRIDIKLDKTPYNEIVNLYHTLLPSLPRVLTLSAKRRSQLKARWKANPDLAFWTDFFKKVSQSTFLTGGVESKDGRTFMADLEWLMKEGNFIKVIEGKYDDKAKKEHSPALTGYVKFNPSDWEVPQ
jgi:predicted phage replisome organizer